ncbi:DUF2897 family protein [Shewanella sp. MMG014]|uniref:DUF2897 family protein n=1 Tax=Shewanella sp. MMG014 TaxID=2822691 RepID=UPI001B36A9EF|nr:DUF2897 family protein [Shewanella sp. MMG014]MBQ4888981.1 DUF2897 family protein [Shewanella sp. MMG014]
MDLSGLEVWIIIILVVGIIASNLAVLKYSAKFKMPQFGDPKKPTDSQGKSNTEHSASDSETQKDK